MQKAGAAALAPLPYNRRSLLHIFQICLSSVLFCLLARARDTLGFSFAADYQRDREFFIVVGPFGCDQLVFGALVVFCENFLQR